METILIIFASIATAVASVYAWKRFDRAREKRLREREYDTAVAIWYFARDVKNEIAEMMRRRIDVL
ncbi:MAG: hypothetical protein AB1631_32890, partial [Acidobacteriota bacterium]